MFPPVTIELIDPPDDVPAGETVPLRFRVARSADELAAAVIPAEGVLHPSAEFDADLISDDIVLHPGEVTSVTVGVRLPTPGVADWSAFEVQVNTPDGVSRDGTLVPLPARPFRVVPSLDRGLELALTRVCTYGVAVKVEVVARNASAHDITSLELAAGPAAAVRTGPLKKCVAKLRPGDEVRFDLVVAAPEVEFAIAALIGGERVEGRRARAVPGGGDSRPDAPRPYTFLEPRALTTDRVALAAERGGAELTARKGIFAVNGGKSRYRLTVYPTDLRARGVRLYSAAGRVEVEDHPADPRPRLAVHYYRRR